jgi:hypothetical protein
MPAPFDFWEALLVEEQFAVQSAERREDREIQSFRDFAPQPVCTAVYRGAPE